MITPSQYISFLQWARLVLVKQRKKQTILLFSWHLRDRAPTAGEVHLGRGVGGQSTYDEVRARDEMCCTSFNKAAYAPPLSKPNRR
jgi:hypothetical protein